MKKPLLILDLDETLIYSSESRIEYTPQIRIGPYTTCARPYLGEFFREIRLYFQLAIWTSSGADYAAEVRRRVLPLCIDFKFVWSSDKCTFKRNFESSEYFPTKNLKKLKKLGNDLNRILMVDDTPEKLRQNYGNAIYVTPWEGQLPDRELLNLARYLISIHGTENFRSIEKRNWREL